MQSIPISRRRGRTALAVAAALSGLALAPSAANAALTIGANAPALGFPASVTDDVSGVSLTSCQDTSGNCVEAPAPNQAAPLSVPDNYTADGEAFYFLAEATVPNAGIGLARFALEQAFTVEEPTAGEQILFGRLRFRFGDLDPGTTYRVTHPYGVDELVADADGIINSTEDVGCVTPPCDFAASDYGRVNAFLTWDPTVGAAPPAGYIGNVAVPHAVIGSPLGTNFVRLEELDGTGAVASVIGESNLFTVQGKLAGAAPTPASFIVQDTTSLSFTDRQVGTTSSAANITLANHGTAPLNVTSAAVGGTDAVDFSVANNGCAAAVAPGSSCTLGIVFAPQATGLRNATLTVASDSLGGPHTFALKGTGTPATLPAPAPVVIQAPAPPPQIVALAPLRVEAPQAALLARGLRAARRARLRTARSRGLTVRFTAPAGAVLARLRLVRVGSNKAVVTKLVPIGRSALQTAHLRYRRARAGRYRLEVSVGRSADSLGPVARSSVTLVR